MPVSMSCARMSSTLVRLKQVFYASPALRDSSERCTSNSLVLTCCPSLEFHIRRKCGLGCATLVLVLFVLLSGVQGGRVIHSRITHGH